jgi:DNA-binding NarL/FixJ family response regulator
MIRVGIIDRHPVTLWGLQSALEMAPGITVTAACATPNEVDPTQLDVLLLDLELPNNMPCVPIVEAMAAHTRVVMTSSMVYGYQTAACFAAGAVGYLYKGSALETYAEAVRTVFASGRLSVPESAGGSLGLSAREHVVLSGIVAGLTHDQVARRLGISTHTVNTHVRRAKVKLNVGNKAELTRAILMATSLAGASA